MKTLLILGDDNITAPIKNNSALDNPDILVSIDKSTNLYRVIKLVLSKSISPALIVKMIICNLRRGSVPSKRNNFIQIKSNKELLDVIEEHKPSRIVLFRAGLIISKKVISSNIPLLNIHCAKIPEYGGIGSIQRALNDKAVNQFATLHQVTTTIDKGKVFDEEPFTLNLKKSYCYNENEAYSAGTTLLYRTLSSKTGFAHNL